MSTRLDKKMAELKAAGKKGIFIYITAGAPDVETTLRAVREAEKAGADVIELGLPFSDPMADGPVIQSSSVCALKNGMTLKKELEIVREIRKFSEIPLIGMGYINNMYHYGFEKFVTDFKAAGMDGIIVPDVPHEESGEMRKICAVHDFHLAEFITPGAPDRDVQGRDGLHLLRLEQRRHGRQEDRLLDDRRGLRESAQIHGHAAGCRLRHRLAGGCRRGCGKERCCHRRQCCRQAPDGRPLRRGHGADRRHARGPRCGVRQGCLTAILSDILCVT